MEIAPIARKKDLIGMYRGAVVSGFVNISVYFNKLANKSLDRFLEKIDILKIRRRFKRPLSLKIIDLLYDSKIRTTIR